MGPHSASRICQSLKCVPRTRGCLKVWLQLYGKVARKPLWQTCWSPKPCFLWCPVCMDGHWEATGSLWAAVPTAEGNAFRAWAAPGAKVPALGAWCPPWQWSSLVPWGCACPQGTCPEVSPDVSSNLLQPVTGARLCFPQGGPMSTACG